MPITKTDYLDEIKLYLENNYDPVDSVLEEDEFTEHKTLVQITKDVSKVLPSDWIYESDVYEALRDLGFKNLMKTFHEVRDKKEGLIKPEKTASLYFLKKKTVAI